LVSDNKGGTNTDGVTEQGAENFLTQEGLNNGRLEKVGSFVACTPSRHNQNHLITEDEMPMECRMHGRGMYTEPWRRQKKRDYYEDTEVGRIILKWILKIGLYIHWIHLAQDSDQWPDLRAL
jgi:hypothetical protein